MRFLLQPQLHEIPDDFHPKKDSPVIELITAEEYLSGYNHLEYHSMLCRSVLSPAIEYCRAEVLPNCILGSIRIPDKSEPLKNTLSFSYYIQENSLLLIDEKIHFPDILQLLEVQKLQQPQSVLGFFMSFLEACIHDDAVYLQNFEHRLTTIEDSLLESLPKELHANVAGGRRELLVFRSYYQQFQDICETFAQNNSGILSDEITHHFTILAGRAQRLCQHTQLLREYALQIQEMHQAQIDIRQNDTMRILTVVTALFMPLSLIAGWYGMNFVYMPETQHPLGYFIILLISILIVCTEIWFFKKKGWI